MIKLGDRVEKELVITQEDMTIFAKISRDENSVHKGESGVVYGMLIMAYISGVIGNDLPGDGSIWFNTKTTFIKPLYVGDKIKIKAVVVKI
jgi:3-hydroxybutyryl-CoA dehydratase